MNLPLYTIAMMTAGAALIAGLTSLFISLYRSSEKVNFYFGLLCLSIFFFTCFPPAGYIISNEEPFPAKIWVKRIFIWAYYILLPLFLEQFSGYRNRKLFVAIVALAIISYVLMLVDQRGSFGAIAWEKLVLVVFFLILIQGVLSTRHLAKSGRPLETVALAVALSFYGLLFAGTFLNQVDPIIIKNLFGRPFFFPMHLNAIAFILIMGIRLQVRGYEKLHTEKALNARNQRWEKLVQNLPSLLLELDMDGRVSYANPAATNLLTSHSQAKLEGTNWFETFIPSEKTDQEKSIYAAFLSGDAPSFVHKNTVLSNDGKEHIIRWTMVHTRTIGGQINGTISIGTDLTELESFIEKVRLLQDELEKETLLMRQGEQGLSTEREIIGSSEAILYAIQKSRQVAPSDAPVLLEGETGVGKEIFADFIQQCSLRSDRPFIKLNCAALPSELVESELFGHVKGSFTGAQQDRKGRFELADKGTLFLDEIGDFPISLQAKLLRVLQSGEFEPIGGNRTIRVDVRIISATNRNLRQEMLAGRFREDLFYRLNVFPITIPALRNRKDDIPLLVHTFINRYARKLKKDISSISKADMARLVAYSWPGNIRELLNVIERSVISSPGPLLRINFLENREGKTELPESADSIRQAERSHILRVLEDCGWKINGPDGAAERLGINPNTLRSRMKKLNLVRSKN